MQSTESSKSQTSKKDAKKADVPTSRPTSMEPGMFITRQQGNFSERYKGVKVLGKGSFGEVILCRDRVTSQECAVKVISKRTLKKSADPASLLREVEFLKKLDHPNIMKLFEFFEDSGYYYLVGELYTGGELFDEIIRRKRCSEQDAARFIKQVLSGIAYMHGKQMVHRDLKPENLLLENKHKDAQIRIIDFGLSTYFEADKGKKMKDKIGTAYYIAPEILKGTYDEKCDVWSCGVILYILLSGCPPFYGSTEADILKRVAAGKYSFNLPQWRKISESAKDLIKKMLTYSPAHRCTALEALEHQWLKTMQAGTLAECSLLANSFENMRTFCGGQQLVDAATLYMGSKLTSISETKGLTEIFNKMDKNSDGHLDRDELIEGYKELVKVQGGDLNQVTKDSIEEEVDNLLRSIDFDKNGYLEYSEFISVAMDRKKLMSEERLKKAFQLFDRDNSGSISYDELVKLFEMTGLSDEDIKKIIREADKNNDGEVDFQEFCALLSGPKS